MNANTCSYLLDDGHQLIRRGVVGQLTDHVLGGEHIGPKHESLGVRVQPIGWYLAIIQDDRIWNPYLQSVWYSYTKDNTY